ncbi:Gfo/Idh/MocA family protein [Pelagicoccus albus]|uniref:Gfo/Idh/MocA family oxidoreductase n=1 Tax=Pelagicoccus albus TaxID=415222 RepID=A0A7X1EA32_9BACT|nr:Gfo/Idh/MocA family oxidoreductase [Pelagicoccus albus]MBC2608074.1 Gfo/Idh/MocA family oxidoreductase [Pelagicoccus albus]
MSLQKKEGQLGLGVLGLGEGRSIISAGVRSDMWQVVSLCDRNEELCRERCREFSLSNYTLNYGEMLENSAIDVIGIYTPDHLHADHVIQALEAGKHVVCTKPFIDNLERAQDVLNAVERSGCKVLVGQSSRFFAPFKRQREHYVAEDFGELVSIESYYHADHRWFLEKEWARNDAFKWLYGAISHPGDLVRWYLPEIEEVYGYAHLSKNGRDLGLKHPDTFHYVLKGANGVPARVSGTYSCPVVPTCRDSNMSCILRCDNGTSQADYYDLRYAYKLNGISSMETFEDMDDYYFRFGGHSHHAGEYQSYIEYIAQCIQNNEHPTPDAREGIVTVAVMQAMEEASKTGNPVRIATLLERYGLEGLISG